MKQPLLLLLFIGLVLVACEPDDEVLTTDSSIQLQFSTDTLYFDTLITDIPARTFRFRAYNPSKNAVNISSIYLGKGAASAYSMVVNGERVDRREDVRLLGGDSLLLLVTPNLTAQNENLPYIVQDSVVFETNGNQQDVKLVAWGQDAIFLRDSILDCDAVWTAERPYVVYDAVLVPEGCQLTVEAGARVFMNNGANVFVGGNLDINGTASDSVVFTSIRQDPPFNRTPGQWGSIVFLGSSEENNISGLRLRNGLFGLFVEPPTTPTQVNVSQSIIENIGFAGVWSFGGDVSMENCLVNNCIAQTFGGIAGGNYRFRHCTFANYSFDFFRDEPSFLLSNFAIINGEQLVASDLNARLENCIVWGSMEEELYYPEEQVSEFISEIHVENSFLKTALGARLATATNLLSDNPLFVDPSIQHFGLDTLSPAIDQGALIGITTDLLGSPRDAKPDLGAYEFQK